MSALLDEVLTAHGGLERWRSVREVRTTGRFGGLLRSRLPGNRMATVTVRMHFDEQWIAFDHFPTAGRHAVFDSDHVRIESDDGEVLQSRHEPRSMFTGLTALRRNFRWDALDATYFAGYAWWNYLCTPLLFTFDGVEVREGAPWSEQGETWRRLEARFSPGLHTHSPQQTFYIDASGLIRRHDYIAEPIGRWARAAHYGDGHREFGGLVFPTRRRVHPIGPRGRALPGPTLVALDIDQIEVTKAAAT